MLIAVLSIAVSIAAVAVSACSIYWSWRLGRATKVTLARLRDEQQERERARDGLA
ncbi:hypothetical protein IU418_26340 [Nocardia farcinica]|uniref:hypothetical protein n=1 Tax=Nocardia farcinica TaxID=37329 RepID=UPI0009D0A3FB|nr:hypothetical protein [Nocardia farcinica]MBF6540730.1 hypothetical protein [Nocardia farcinica]SLG33446.1 Uncharacterised protein [Mycobacteroides abscessus subsp. abscessus]